MVAGGAYIVQTYMESRSRQEERREVEAFLENTRRAYHLESSLRTGTTTLRDSIFPGLANQVEDEFVEINTILERLRANDPKEKKSDLWADLCESCLSKCSALAVYSSIFAVTVRLQLSMIAGQVWSNSILFC